MNKTGILENLKDAGYKQNLIEDFLNLEKRAQINLLIKHRSTLLKKLHKCQKQIDCLDYLIFSLKQ